MPTSQHRQISAILDLITHLQPKRVLDVGLGVGAYGFLIAEAFDQTRLFPEGKHSPDLVLDGIEGFGDYVGPVQRTVYDNITIGNAAELLPELGEKSYDLLVLIDVLEHFATEDVPGVLAVCKRVAKTVLVSTPHAFAHQGHAHGNELEEHLSHPSRADLSAAGFSLFLPDSASLIGVYSDDRAFLSYYGKKLLNNRIRSVLPARALNVLANARKKG